jgi:hypothetical protein
MREHTRANFEYFVELVWKASLTTEIWTRDTIIERTKKFLSAWIDISEGKLQKKAESGRSLGALQCHLVVGYSLHSRVLSHLSEMAP